MNTIAAPARKRTTKAITIRPFKVSYSRLEITVKILAATADYLSSRSDIVRSRYGEDVWSFAIPAEHIIEAGQRGEYSAAQVSANLRNTIGHPDLHESLQGRKTAVIKIVIKPIGWEAVETVAAFLKCSETAIVRAALEQRRRGIIEFDRKEMRAKQIAEKSSLEPLPKTAPEQLTHGLQIPCTREEMDAWLRVATYSGAAVTASQWGRRALLAAARIPVSRKASVKPTIPRNENLVTVRFTLDEHFEFSKKAQQCGLSLLEWACLSLRAAWSKKAEA